MSSQRKQTRAQGGGRTANSEPRLQVFRDFAGINFEHTTKLGEYVTVDRYRGDGEHTDQQMNYMFLQNNVSVVSNKTLETRDDIKLMFIPPEGVEFTGPVCLIGENLYAAKSDGNIGIGNVQNAQEHPEYLPYQIMSNNVLLENNTGSYHLWNCIDHYDNKLIGLTSSNEIWTGPMIGSNVGVMSNAVEVPDPTDTFVINGSTGTRINPKGSLSISQTMSDNNPFRITVAYTYVNKFGPTNISQNTVFYANHPVSEWHAGCYLQFNGPIPQDYGIKAVELYYASDNAMDMLFLGRRDVSSSATTWSYNWYGYIDATSMWPIANLIAPNQNYTKGVSASRMCVIDGRMYFWGDIDYPERLWIGGNPGNLLSVSPGTGGGFVDVEPGTGQTVKYVCKYKTQSGNSIVTMLCSSPNTYREQRFNLVENTVSISNEQSMSSWQAEQVAGAVGTRSYRGAVVCEDGIYSISRYGLALTTMTMEYNSQIQTNYVSDAVKPIFIESANRGSRLNQAMILELDGIIYMAFGVLSDPDENLDNVIFCYDIDLKAWWTYTLDVDSPIKNLFHVDYDRAREGIGIVTKDAIYILPTTVEDNERTLPDHKFLIQSSQLSTQMPQQGWQYLSQLEFHFDYFIGDMNIMVRMVDMFGRPIEIDKKISESDIQSDFVVRMRIDQRTMFYEITMSGFARFRMTHFIARVYTLSNKIGQVWGFDDSISHRFPGNVQPAFECYNDVRKAIFT